MYSKNNVLTNNTQAAISSNNVVFRTSIRLEDSYLSEILRKPAVLSSGPLTRHGSVNHDRS